MSGSKQAKGPKVMLVGTFPDVFLEAITDLEVNFFLHKSTKVEKQAKADIVVIAEDRKGEVMDFVMKTRAVPVVREGVRGFTDFDPISETGNGFLFHQNSPWHMLQSLLRAIDTYKFVYDWKVIQSQINTLKLESSAMAA